MFNFTYAIIGVLIGMAVEPVGRAINHGPARAPLWASSSLAKLITSIAMFGFIIFSATFGLEYAVYAILEIIVGTFISYFLAHR